MKGNQTRQEPSGIMGALVIMVLLLFIIGALRQRPEDTPILLTPPATKVGNTAVLVRVSPTLTSSPSATPSNTPTAVPTHTETPTAVPTHTPTLLPTHTAAPPATPTPLFTVTPTQTPIPLPTPQPDISLILRVPILMYHYISTPPEDADVYRIDLSVEPDVFQTQMAYLAENGYTPISLADLSLALAGQQPLPERPLILTFDDGYVDNYENAFPILESYGFKATFFVVSEFIDKGRAGYVTWEMVKEMAAAGHHIESHSRTHPDLTEQDHEALIWQIVGPSETIAFHTGVTPRYLSYPSGRYNEQVIEILQALDYWGAVTTFSGKEHTFAGRYEWPRLRIRHNTPLAEFIDLVQPTQ